MQTFRNATKKDIEAIVLLEKLSFSDAWTRRSLLETYEQKQSFITVAEKSGNVVGYCIVYFVLDEGEIARIAVHPNEQHRGIGRRLLDYTCEICREKKIGSLMLDVRESNASARKFYEHCRFTKDGIRKNFYERPKENAVLMSKQIG